MSVLAMLLALSLSAGQSNEASASADPRVQLVTYNPGQVVTLNVDDGFAAVVELGSDERVDSVVVGNSAVWQVTASKRGDHVVVKPLIGAAPTDMVVITAARRYVFLLQPGNDGGQAPFLLRFIYPQTKPIALVASVAQATFRLRGDKALFPASMHDDGRRTIINWQQSTALPAIFAVELDGREAIVNGRMVGSEYIVERIAQRFVFRSGKERATATRRKVRFR